MWLFFFEAEQAPARGWKHIDCTNQNKLPLRPLPVIIRRRRSFVFLTLSRPGPPVTASHVAKLAPRRPDFEEDRMMFEETLYLRDDEADEFGDSGAYGDTLEEDYEEEEEEEESELPSVMEEEPEPASPEPA